MDVEDREDRKYAWAHLEHFVRRVAPLVGRVQGLLFRRRRHGSHRLGGWRGCHGRRAGACTRRVRGTFSCNAFGRGAYGQGRSTHPQSPLGTPHPQVRLQNERV